MGSGSDPVPKSNIPLSNPDPGNFAIGIIPAMGGEYTIYNYLDKNERASSLHSGLERDYTDPGWPQSIANLYGVPVVDLRTVYKIQDIIHMPDIMWVSPKRFIPKQEPRLTIDEFIDWFYQRGAKVYYPQRSYT